jgi:NADH-quinone oxidoreductase subunit J
MISADAILFWFLAIVTVASALTVVLITNPIFSALSLVMTMVGIAALFVTLGAYFIAGVQLIVYAGAVMVLFVMVLMLFDLKQEVHAFSRGQVSGLIKVAGVGMLAGLIVGAILMTSQLFEPATNVAGLQNADTTKALGKLLFTKYVFSFEALGILLLVVAVGTVALSRSKGGTHAKH